MCCEWELFTKFGKHTEQIGLAGAGLLQAEGKGNVKIQTDLCMLAPKNLLYVLKTSGNCMSVSSSVQNRCKVIFEIENAKDVQDGKCTAINNKIGNFVLF